MFLDRRGLESVLLALLVAVAASAAAIAQGGRTARSGASEVSSAGGDYLLVANARATTLTSSGDGFRLDGAVHRLVLSDGIFSDDFESGDLSAWAPPHGMPTGAVAFFAAALCPSGWSPLAAAAGRTLVGTPAGGTHGGTQGAPLGNLESRTHYQSASDSSATAWATGHMHLWSYFSEWLYWSSHDASGRPITVFRWNDGIDGEGSGYYPLAAGLNDYLYADTDPLNGHYHDFTMSAGGWSVDACLPYVQLLVCRKV